MEKLKQFLAAINKQAKSFHVRSFVGAGIALVIIGVLLFWGHNAQIVQLPNRVQDLLTLTLSIIFESMPFVVLGIVLSVVVQFWLPQDALTRWLPKRSVLRRLYISCFGVFLPVCECGNLPMARGLIAKGLTPAESLTFLLAAPILNPITIITTMQAFPGDHTIVFVRVAAAFLIANLVGWVFSAYKKQQDILTDEFVATCEASEHMHVHSRTQQSARLFARELGIILPALFIGALVAGCIQTLVPREVLLGLGGNLVVSIIAMMALAFIVSICSNVDAFFALAFSSTFSVGSIVSFLVFGPMIDIKMLSLMRTTYRPKVLAQVAFIVLLASFAVGLGVNYAL